MIIIILGEKSIEKKSKSVHENLKNDENLNEFEHKKAIPKNIQNYLKYKKFYSYFQFIDVDAHPKKFTKGTFRFLILILSKYFLEFDFFF